ncbi:MAG: DUF4416 family protein [Candidatus Cloacimonetes bacterium]|nr:DUF4416 family protein [Candidatus Cloacimonadota bacterium]
MQPVEVQSVKLVIGFLYRERGVFRQALERVRAVWGESDYQSEEYFFDLTDYYETEMGKPIFRSFNSYSRLISPGELADIKLRTNQIEQELRSSEGRKVNLDPGYLDYDKLVLASAKYNHQKVYLSVGIYADITLFYRKGRYIAPEWAFPDFQAGLYENDFLQIRHLYKQQLKELNKSGT